MKPSFMFQIRRFFNHLVGWGMGIEKGHYVFNLPLVGEDLDFYLFSEMAQYGYTPNDGWIYKHQIYQCRLLVEKGRYQYHVRFHKEPHGIYVTSHYETSPEWDVSDHLKGVGLRDLDSQEVELLKYQLAR